MTDLLDRLKEQAKWYSDGHGELHGLAADEIERLRAALRTTRQYLKDEMIAHALVMVDGKPESEWPTLLSVIDAALGSDEQNAGKTER